MKTIRFRDSELANMRAAIACGIRDQEDLIECHIDEWTGEPIKGHKVVVKSWRAEVEQWKMLRRRFSENSRA